LLLQGRSKNLMNFLEPKKMHVHSAGKRLSQLMRPIGSDISPDRIATVSTTSITRSEMRA